jgi:hypothetical protein
MRTLLAVVTLALGTVVAAPAYAAAPSDTDSGCGAFVVAGTDPGAPSDMADVVLFGGPIAQNGTLTCTVKRNQYLHDSPAVGFVSHSVMGTRGVTQMPPTYLPGGVHAPGEPVYVCDQFDDGSVTWVLDARTDRWVPAGTAGAKCYLMISAGTGDPIFDPIHDLIESLDPLTCSVLVTVRGVPGVIEVDDTGDVYVLGGKVYDCAPYDDDDDDAVSVQLHVPASITNLILH